MRQSDMSPELALRLEIVIGSTAETRLRMQAACDAAKASDRAGSARACADSGSGRINDEFTGTWLSATDLAPSQL